MSSEDEWHSDDQKFIRQPVVPSHTRTDRGVRFNVRTVDKLGMLLPIMNPQQTVDSIKGEANKFYGNPESRRTWRDRSQSPTSKCELEAHSVPSNFLLRHPAKSLAHIALAAFADHYPLALRPDDIWLTIACGAAKHIDKNAEGLRSRFVNFEGKKALDVDLDNVIMGRIPKHVWEKDVFSSFSHQIRENVRQGIYDLFSGRFSTTTKTDKAASEITLMASVSKYFTYQVFTLCGIPCIELQGSLEDWIMLKERAEKLKALLLDDFAEKWMGALLPVLDEFIEAYKGNVNHEFWQRMVKKVNSDFGSGKSCWLSGWIINLYPYLSHGKVNRYIKDWREISTDDGPEPYEIPLVLSSVPVTWKYYGKELPLHFHAGILGMVQDRETKSLRPHVGWMITHDPVNAAEKPG